MSKKRVGIIGVTGSVGSKGAEIISLNKDMFEVVFITAHSNHDMLKKYADKLHAAHSFLTHNNDGTQKLKSILKNEKLDIVLHAGSGVGAIESVYDVACSGATLALANKESIVTAGVIIKDAAKKSGSKILPVDSEHSAIFQCLQGNDKKNIEKIVLTASGGPFRTLSKDALHHVTLADALKHPKWNMGKKITIDSASMMNKGLELIEAKYLFDVEADKLDVVIHPQSIIHSYVAFSDGGIMAQMGEPCMKLPIAYALGFPERIITGVKVPDMATVGNLTFEKPDLNKFKCLNIAIDVLKSGSNALMTTLNAANEAAVISFLDNRIMFTDIPKIVEAAIENCSLNNAVEIGQAIENNKLATTGAANIIAKYAK